MLHVLGERRCGRSSSAAKKPAAALRISFARFSSAFSYLNSLTCVDSSVVVPSRVPLSIWSCRTHERSVPVEPIPSLEATVDYADRAMERPNASRYGLTAGVLTNGAHRGLEPPALSRRGQCMSATNRSMTSRTSPSVV